MVRIIYAEANPAFQMASDNELKQLQRIVLAKHPQLRPEPGCEDVYHAAFKRSFWALGQLGRREEPETKNAHSVMWWLEHCRELLDAANNYGDIELRPWVAALAAHGDVPYSRLDRFPYDLAFGLHYGGAGRAASDAWRHVIASGQLLAPTAIAIPQWSATPDRVVNVW
jgi:hypothetical protein